jgi:hypothetical protein
MTTLSTESQKESNTSGPKPLTHKPTPIIKTHQEMVINVLKKTPDSIVGRAAGEVLEDLLLIRTPLIHYGSTHNLGKAIRRELLKKDGTIKKKYSDWIDNLAKNSTAIDAHTKTIIVIRAAAFALALKLKHD